MSPLGEQQVLVTTQPSLQPASLAQKFPLSSLYLWACPWCTVLTELVAEACVLEGLSNKECGHEGEDRACQLWHCMRSQAKS